MVESAEKLLTPQAQDGGSINELVNLSYRGVFV